VAGGEHVWVGNAYLPPTQCLAKRGIAEADARESLENILFEIPTSSRAVVCGDFNARIGTLSPDIDGVKLDRNTVDLVVCKRAQWFVHTCEILKMHILNGASKDGEAFFTYG
jgi:hypothetical protein